MKTTDKTYRANSLQVRNKIKEHILEYFEYEVSDDLTKFDPEEALKNQIDSMANPGEILYQTASRLVDGGHFLIYYDDQREFLDSLHLNNNSGRKFTDEDVYTMYIRLLSAEIERICK